MIDVLQALMADQEGPTVKFFFSLSPYLLGQNHVWKVAWKSTEAGRGLYLHPSQAIYIGR